MTSTTKSALNRVLAVLGGVLIVATGVVLVTARSPDAAVTPATASVNEVDITDFKYAPAAISVKAGTTITWTNRDSAPHTATSGASPNPDRVFETDIITKGQSKKIKISKRGTFEYYCALHPFMKATVTVR